MALPFRRSLEVAGVTHGGAPIPMASRVGNMIFSSGVMGKDPATDKVADGAEAQAHFMFQHIKTLVEAGGGTLENIAHLTVFIKEDLARDAVNKEWLKAFPDPHNRPARHTLIYNLRGSMLMQVEFVAVLPTGHPSQ